MSEPFTTRLLGTERRRHIAYGLALLGVGLVVFAAPSAQRLRQSMHELATARSTYAVKQAWADRKGEIEQRLSAQEAATAALDARLMSATDLPGFTQRIAAAARATGCSVQSVQPTDPRILPYPVDKSAEGQGGSAKREKPVQFVEWTVRVAVQGEYDQVAALLHRLSESGTRFCSITQLALQPNGDERQQLNCDLELAGYGLRPAPSVGN